MRLKNIPGAREALERSHYALVSPETKINYTELFGNDKPVELEIGAGRGDFVIGMAKAFPDINFIALEKYDSALYKALQKLEEEPLDNVRLVVMDAEDILDVFGPVSKIYLNFSDPWPKARHEKRRLTYKSKLDLYKELTNEIVFKTDNRPFFDYSLESFKEYGMKIHYVSYDLHTEDVFNVETEFERRFSGYGEKINKCIATFE